MGESGGGDRPDGILLSVAPAAVDLPRLLRTAIDAEQVGAARVHLAADQPDVAEAVTAIRAHTSLVITADPGSPAAALTDTPGPQFTEVVLPADRPAPELLVELARLAEADGATSVGGRDAAAMPVLLAALAVGLHLRVGTADQPPNPALDAPGLGSEPIGGGPHRQGAGPAPGVAHGPGAARSPGPAGPRDDVGLIARAAGLARIAGRRPLSVPEARAVLGLS